MSRTRGLTGWWLACAISVLAVCVLQGQQTIGSGRVDDRDLVQLKSVLDQPGAIPGADALGLAWVRYDALKSRNLHQQYVPFTIAIDPRKVTTRTVALYWRVTPRMSNARGPRQTSTPIAEGSRGVSLQPASARTYVSQSFDASPGEYQVTVVAKEVSDGPAADAGARLAAVSEEMLVPDYWNDEFTTSPIIAAEAIVPLTQPVSSNQRTERPYALQQFEIRPFFGGRFTRRMDFWTLMEIYNAKMDARTKPDVQVEYRYFLKQGTAEKLFNQTAPQRFDSSTLPPAFNIAAGDQLESSQGVPLASFPPGTYRLEVRVTDRVSNETLTRELEFTVE